MRLLFISDLHLSEKRPDLAAALFNFIEEIDGQCDALYLLGDIFDAWIGDDFIPPQLNPLLSRLRQLAENGTQLFFVHGNRDFLVGSQLMESIGATLLPEQYLLEMPDGRTTLISHGDELCLDDTEYQAFRAMVRQTEWQSMFLSKSLEERLEIARGLRATSKEKTAEKQSEIMDVHPQAVRDALNMHKCDRIIHGHTHRPAVHDSQLNADEGTRIVLGDWDTHLWYLDCTESGCELISRAIPCT